MSTNIKKLILKKNKGNITSLIFGQLFLFLMLVWCLFSYRLTILNAVFNYVDDSLTSSCLGAALVNVEEYGKSNQLVIHNNEKYNTKDWETEEKAILLSELNYGSDITLTDAEIDPKPVMDYTNRKHGNDEDYVDTYLRRALSAFAYCMNYNLSNGLAGHTYSAENILNNVKGDGGYQSIKIIPHDEVLGKSFLGDYIVTDITVSRFDIYSVYRDRLAQRHVYATLDGYTDQSYIQYNFNGGGYYNYKELDNKTLNKQGTVGWRWNPNEPANDTEFKNWHEPTKWELTDAAKARRSKTYVIKESDYKLVDGEKVENPSYASELLTYKRELKRFQTARSFYNAHSGDGKLVCYTDTQTTYQGKFNQKDNGTYVERVPFNFLYVDSNGVSPGVTESNFKGIYGNNVTQCVEGEKSPIEYWSVYSYKEGTGTTFEDRVYNGGEPLKPTVQGGKMNGAEIENTSIYVELTFTIKTFPTPDTFQEDKDYTGTDITNPSDADVSGWRMNTMENTKTVTVARLIDIELNTDVDTIIH